MPDTSVNILSRKNWIALSVSISPHAERRSWRCRGGAVPGEVCPGVVRAEVMRTGLRVGIVPGWMDGATEKGKRGDDG